MRFIVPYLTPDFEGTNPGDAVTCRLTGNCFVSVFPQLPPDLQKTLCLQEGKEVKEVNGGLAVKHSTTVWEVVGSSPTSCFPERVFLQSLWFLPQWGQNKRKVNNSN